MHRAAAYMLAVRSLSFCRILGSIVLFNSAISLRVIMRTTLPLCFTEDAFFAKESILLSKFAMLMPPAYQVTLKPGGFSLLQTRFMRIYYSIILSSLCLELFNLFYYFKDFDNFQDYHEKFQMASNPQQPESMLCLPLKNPLASVGKVHKDNLLL